MRTKTLRWRRHRSTDDLIARHTVGNALVLHARERISHEARSIALAVAADDEHDIVVLDLPEDMQIGVWEAVANALQRRRRSIRLVVCGRRRETTALAGQWLSERLRRTVLVPHGHVIPGIAGSLFVDSGSTSGWVRYEPGQDPAWEGKRFPRPHWDGAVTEYRKTSSTGVVEPLPGGVWIHDTRSGAAPRDHWRWLVTSVPCQPDTMTAVLGCPGSAALSLDEVARFWRGLDEDSRERARFVQYGPVDTPSGEALGQVIADLLGAPVRCYTGIPVGAPSEVQLHTVCLDGTLGWQTFARELAYTPRADRAGPATVPAIVAHRPPFGLTEQVAPRVYWYAPDAVIEVVQAGLWLRPVEAPKSADRIRATRATPERHMLIFDDATEHRAARMRALAVDAMAQLDPATRERSALMAATVVLAALAAPGLAGGQLTVDVIDDSAATAVGAADEVTTVAEAAAFLDVPAPTYDDTVQPVAALPEPASAATAESVEAPADVAVGVPVRPADHGTGDLTVDVPPMSARPAPALAPASAAVPSPRPVADVGRTAADARPAPGGPRPTAVAPPAPAAAPDPEPPTEPVGRPTEPERAPAAGPARFQPVPKAAASALLLPGRDLAEERAWLRKTLQREFTHVASSIARVMSQQPGLQGDSARPDDEILTDAVAVRLYLSRQGAAIDAALRSARGGPHVPFARCAVSGLSRLPSHRGATVFAAAPTEEQWQMYADRQLTTEWGFVHALTKPAAPDPGRPVDVLIWSMTARRTRLLEPDGDEQVADRVLYVPGTSFKVLDMVEPNGETRGRILLRELAADEIDGNGRVDADRTSYDELARTSLRRCADRWATPTSTAALSTSAATRFGDLPGLV